MDIAGLSMNLSQANLAQAVGIRVLKLAQTNAVQQSLDFVKMMEQSALPHLGQRVDIKA